MQKLFIYLFKGCKYLKVKFLYPIDWFISFLIFYFNNVKTSSFITYGIPKVNVGIGGKFSIGKNFRMHNRESSNPIGRFNRCSFIIGKKGNLTIGDSVGMSSTGIVCHENIQIGNNVAIGGNVVIYDTDFHSLNADDRKDGTTDRLHAKTRPVFIANNVFIGGHSTILKGVSIGENSIIGAGSVVSRNIPKNEIWAGNPAIKIKDLN